MIKRLLIANRGEIACRIIKTAKQLGIQTLAVYSDADADAQHKLLADESFALGGNTAADSYLNKEKIIALAKEHNACAIHPGYGFLAEDGSFSRAVNDAGLIFVGPSGENIELMGDKESAKTCASDAGLPIAKDFCGDFSDTQALTKAANEIGYPLLVKASAGGGGKGMRLVSCEKDLIESVQAAAREAEASFGNAAVFLEQYIRPARHIEVQIARDTQGNAVHLFTRDCSIQRRHQKVVEEAPAHIPTEVEAKMCQVSLELAHHIGYTGLGTLEFLLDQNNQFYFMEMNTRLQVEHPVTEMITNLDCVALQLEIAAGNEISVKQEAIRCQGHAIEVRVCAENPLQDFMPSTGKLKVLHIPTDARFDTGVIEGDAISPYYDSMIAKVISHGDNRDRAIEELHHALCNTHIVGPQTNVEFVNTIIQLDDFKQEKISTEFIEQHFTTIKDKLETLTPDDINACAQAYLDHQLEQEKLSCSNDFFSPWHEYDSWRATGSHRGKLKFRINEEEKSIGTDAIADTNFSAYFTDKILHVFYNGKHFLVATQLSQGSLGEASKNNSVLSSPMPGTVTQILVEEGDEVKVGDILICIEAMKMEHSIKATANTHVKKIHVCVGDTTHENQDLVELDL